MKLWVKPQWSDRRKWYDTDTAKIVASWDNGKTGPDRISEILHRKTSGEYFLHIVGGASVGYDASSASTVTEADQSISPLRYGDARKWAESRLSSDEVDKVFSSDGKRVYTKLNPEASVLLEDEMSRSGRKMYEVINDCIIKQLGRKCGK